MDMYTDKKNVLQLVSLMKQFGVEHIVLCPGNRNVPLVHTFESDSFFTCYSIVDERSAAYFALGLTLRHGKPAAVCSTSGTAALNFIPAVAEAFYQGLPLIVVTADRPNMYLGQNEDQMVPQRTIFKDIVKISIDLPEVNDKNDEWYCNRLINEALLDVSQNEKKPVHINITQWGSLTNFPTMKIPTVRKIYRYRIDDLLYGDTRQDVIENLKDKRRIILIFGQDSRNLSEKEKEQIDQFVSKFNVVVLADNLSNFHHDHTINNIEYSLSKVLESKITELIPDLIISVGGQTLSGVKGFIKQHCVNVNHWLISESSAIVDEFKNLSILFYGDYVRFFQILLEQEIDKSSDRKFLENWKEIEKNIDQELSEFSDIAVVQQLMKIIPKGSSLHLANSTTVRIAQLFRTNPNIKIFCNRGTHGIDGSVSTAVGYSTGSDELTYLIIGDLSFFYDSNGLWNRHIRSNMRIILNNNGGAGIFHYTMGRSKIDTINDHIAADQNYSAKGIAETFGFDYLSASNFSELKKCLLLLITQSSRPIILEVFTDKEHDATVRKQIMKPRNSTSRKIKNKVKQYIR
jgi:2-succinyl-5-enolpyruvyl-6-hydroxy-3-cyclohexene-1-carboxylate synthase